MAQQRPISEALEGVAGIVEQRLVLFFEEIKQQPPTRLFDTRLGDDLLEEVRDLTLRGGKRLRAALLIHGAGLFEPCDPPNKSVLDAATSIELLHTYLLIHDDIMDHDDVRRGGPSVHAALARKTGSGAKGQDLAILAGDLAAALSQILLAAIEVDADRFRRVHKVFAAMHLDVIHGQTLDLSRRTDATEIATHKTASYTTIGPLAAGAAIAGASDEEIAYLASVAMPLGVAFQYRDDLLGTFGRPGATGKSSKNDLCEGKRTILVEEAFVRANDRQRSVIEAVLGNENAGEEELARARDILERCGARAACQDRILALVDQFTAGLEAKSYHEEAKRFLISLAQFVGRRET